MLPPSQNSDSHSVLWVWRGCPHLWMRIQRLREVKSHAQGHKAGRRQSRPGTCAVVLCPPLSKSTLLTARLRLGVLRRVAQAQMVALPGCRRHGESRWQVGWPWDSLRRPSQESAQVDPREPLRPRSSGGRRSLGLLCSQWAGWPQPRPTSTPTAGSGQGASPLEAGEGQGARRRQELGRGGRPEEAPQEGRLFSVVAGQPLTFHLGMSPCPQGSSACCGSWASLAWSWPLCLDPEPTCCVTPTACLTSLSLGFYIWKVGLITGPASLREP